MVTNSRISHRLPIVTKVLAAKHFYPAEQYHQKYYQKNSLQYQFYRQGSGHEDYLKRMEH